MNPTISTGTVIFTSTQNSDLSGKTRKIFVSFRSDGRHTLQSMSAEAKKLVSYCDQKFATANYPK